MADVASTSYSPGASFPASGARHASACLAPSRGGSADASPHRREDVGHGGAFFLQENPRAYHVRLVAAVPDRMRRVMAARWLNEEPARRVLEETDRRRESFVRHFFGAVGADPLHYHAVYNTSRVPPEAAARRIADAVRERESEGAEATP